MLMDHLCVLSFKKICGDGGCSCSVQVISSSLFQGKLREGWAFLVEIGIKDYIEFPLVAASHRSITGIFLQWTRLEAIPFLCLTFI